MTAVPAPADTPFPPAGSRAGFIPAAPAGRPDEFWDRFVKENGARMFSVARRLLRCEEDRADAVQDALVSAFRFRGAFQGRAAVETWLHRVVVNACLMLLRSRSRREKRLCLEADGSAALAQAADRAGHGPSEPAERAELSRSVTAFLGLLSEPYRTVLHVRDIEGCDVRETARRLGISVCAVRTRHHRARRALRALLEPVIDTLLPEYGPTPAS